ncbi:hypothetical protein FIBSPDRAFT_460526 [Athelia psychrophila]|uniref:Uncharacterized protein n=1 Tax=Athelia psychrophila TaxID=1759441 RepID=A0A166LTC6_9AGAM|nr:hypothetical protein FIBSPDRAFT_460526 [Fibularhizoctonia sp. CBS 109695]
MPAAAPMTVFNITNTAGNARINKIVYHVTPDHEDKIYRWLAAPDSSGNLHAAQEEHHDNTGTWFIEGEAFAKWKKTSDSAMWVYGTRESCVEFYQPPC